VSGVTPETFLGVFMIFCRLGGCLLVAPGFASPRVSPQVRLFIALTVTFALAPLLLPKVGGLVDQSPVVTLWWIGCETLTGLIIGLFGRAAYFALETMTNLLATSIGFGAIPGTAVTENETTPMVGSLIMMAATTLIFATGLHWELFRGLVASYDRIPPGESFGTRLALSQLVDHLTAAFTMALRLTSPFVVYSVIVNLALGLANKLSPQIPVFFIATPFLMAGGLFLLMYLSSDLLSAFIRDYARSLRMG
jgi:flagellar biosynthetic protein FliR